MTVTPWPIPATICDVTPAWLTAALSRSPTWSGRTIVSADALPIGGQDSLASAVYRVDISVILPDGRSDQKYLLVKMHHPDPAQRDDGGYVAEARFYRERAPRISALVPETYLAEYDDRDRRLVIVQEFLSDGQIGSASSSLTVVELERVLSSLAMIHATWWDDPSLNDMSGVRPFDAVIRRAIVNLRNGELDIHRFLDRFGALVDPALVDAYAAMPQWMEQVALGLAGRSTLIHLDCSAKNLFIPRDPQRAPVLFDWALFRSGHPALDLATLLCYSMDPEEHDRMPALVRGYHEQLATLGVCDLDADALWDAVRWACLWRLAAPVFNAMAATEARDAHVRAIVPRLNSAIFSSHALKLIRSTR